MPARADIAIFGTGQFAARILFDLAATAGSDLTVAIIGRDPDRLAWLRTAAAARAAMFGTPVRIVERRLAAFSAVSAAELLAELRPRVVANTASVQGGRRTTPDIAPDAWSALVAEAGLGVTAVLQARISIDMSRAVAQAVPGTFFINCCYPDVVNPMIAAAGLPIASGVGNVAILAHAFAGALGPGQAQIALLAQHAALSAFRRPASERSGVAPLRLWLDGHEVADVFARFAAVKLAPEPVIDISGASAAPFFVALAAGAPWRGHAPGPNGLPGGYPVRLRNGALTLDLPDAIAAEEAIAWNAAFEAHSGVSVGVGGMVRYTGKIRDALHSVSPAIAQGFAMAAYDAAFEAHMALRTRLQSLDLPTGRLEAIHLTST